MGKNRKRKRPKASEKLGEASGVAEPSPKKPNLVLQTTSTALEIPPVICSQSPDKNVSLEAQQTPPPTTAEQQNTKKATPSSDIKRRVTRSMTKGNAEIPLTEIDETLWSPHETPPEKMWSPPEKTWSQLEKTWSKCEKSAKRVSSKKRRQKSKLETIAPHSFVRSRVNDIRDSPWLSKDEFAAVYTWLYSNRTELMSKGVARVAAWSTRGTMPVGIDITAHLCEAFLMEMKYNAGNSYRAVSFGFSVAITR
jgi:DNA-binding transcriptional regulator YiaG